MAADSKLSLNLQINQISQDFSVLSLKSKSSVWQKILFCDGRSSLIGNHHILYGQKVWNKLIQLKLNLEFYSEKWGETLRQTGNLFLINCIMWPPWGVESLASHLLFLIDSLKFVILLFVIPNDLNFQVPRLVLLQHQIQVLANQHLANLPGLQLQFLAEGTPPCSTQHRPNLKLGVSLVLPLPLQLLDNLKQHKLLLVRVTLKISFYYPLNVDFVLRKWIILQFWVFQAILAEMLKLYRPFFETASNSNSSSCFYRRLIVFAAWYGVGWVKKINKRKKGWASALNLGTHFSTLFSTFTVTSSLTEMNFRKAHGSLLVFWERPRSVMNELAW